MSVNIRNVGSSQTLSRHVQNQVCHAGIFALLANLLLLWRRFLPLFLLDCVNVETVFLFIMHHVLIVTYSIALIAPMRTKKGKSTPMRFRLVYICLFICAGLLLRDLFDMFQCFWQKYLFAFSRVSLYFMLFFNIQYVFFLALGIVKKEFHSSAASWTIKLAPLFLFVAAFLYSCVDICRATTETKDAICMKPCIDSNGMDTEQLHLFSKLYKFRMRNMKFFFDLENTIEGFIREGFSVDRNDSERQASLDNLMSSEIIPEFEDIITQYETRSCPKEKYLVMSAEYFEEPVMGVAQYLCLRFIDAVCKEDISEVQMQFHRLSSWEEIAMLHEPCFAHGSDFILSAKITELRLRVLNAALEMTDGDFRLALELFAKVELMSFKTQSSIRLALTKEKLAWYYLMHCCRQDFKEKIGRNLFIGYDKTKHIANTTQSDWPSIMGVDVLDPWPESWRQGLVQQGELVASGPWLSAWSDSLVCSVISRELKNEEITVRNTNSYPMFYYKYIIFNVEIAHLNQIHQTLLALSEFVFFNATVWPYPERGWHEPL